ncbi:hypothetical protein [Methylobacterium sp. Leaf89]|uniref:hypothetical protein n=1 Tax=Methylobacterium sp. Leaf89 TaxID=1736245 RepID=UPI000AF06D55|nr:hypothetical protein [Methylobacterium sp. Leaf89]
MPEIIETTVYRINELNAVACDKAKLPFSTRKRRSRMGPRTAASTRTSHSFRAKSLGSNAPQELPFNELILIPRAAAGVV